MGGSKPPQPTDPRIAIGAQKDANTFALQESQAANQVNQGNTQGTQTWQLLGYDQYGNPQYGMSQQYNPQQQALQNFSTGTQSIAGFGANNLMNDIYSRPEYNMAFDPTNDVNVGVNTRMGQMQNYMDPFLSKQRQDRDNEMRNQGLVPGMEAYDEEMNRIQDQQQQSMQSLLAQFQPQAFSQAYQQRGQPLAEAQELAKFGSPMPLGFSATPQYAQAGANAVQAYNNYDQQRMAAWQAQQQQRSGLLQGLGSIGGMVLGGPVGSAIGSGLAGYFGPQGSLT